MSIIMYEIRRVNIYMMRPDIPTFMFPVSVHLVRARQRVGGQNSHGLSITRYATSKCFLFSKCLIKCLNKSGEIACR